MSKIFKLLSKEKNEPLTIDEFVESYVFFEEQLRIKIKKIEKYLDDLTEDKKECEDNLKKAQNEEEPKINGLTNKSRLLITIIEGKDLNQGCIMGECNPFVQITFQGETQSSEVKNGTENPAFNENFKFELNSLEGTIKIEVLNKTILGNKNLGVVSINLNDLKDQEERLNWFDLNEGQGKIRLKLLCILNLVQYYEDKLSKINGELKYFEKVYEELGSYEDIMKAPFGIIYCDNLEPLLNTESLRNSQNLIDIGRNSKQYVYAVDDGRLKGSRDKIKWGRGTQVLMILLIASTFFTLLERSDFLNLFISIILMILFFLDKNSDIEKYLQPLIMTIGGSLLYDFFWFMINFFSFITDYDNPEINLRRLVYFASISNFVIKLCLISGLNRIKKRKLESKTLNLLG